MFAKSLDSEHLFAVYYQTQNPRTKFNLYTRRRNRRHETPIWLPVLHVGI